MRRGLPDKIAIEKQAIRAVWPAAASLKGRQTKESPDMDSKGGQKPATGELGAGEGLRGAGWRRGIR